MGTTQTVAAVTALLILITGLFGLGTEGCGWTTTALSGTVQSPNFPSNYTDGLNCIYVITAPAGYQITLNFTEFDLEPHSSCSYDYVDIRDGDAASPLIDQFCGTSLPKTRRTFGNQMWIQFISDESTTGRGFRATFTADLQAPFFLITSSIHGSNVGGRIRRLDVETVSNYILPVADQLYQPMAVDYDAVEQTIYWTEVGREKRIRASSISGGGMRTVLNTGNASAVNGLAVDSASRLIFYTDAGRDLIAMMTISTSAHRTIINTDLDQPQAIALNIADGVMFWGDWGALPKIERANYDGTDRRTLISTNLLLVNGLALDVHNNYLYWVDGGTDLVERSDMEGQNRKTLLPLDVTESYHFFGLAHLHDSLYITDWITGGSTSSSKIRHLDLKTGSVTVYGSISGHRLNDIHVYDPQRPSNESENGCGNNNGGCDVICIPLPGHSSKCLCPDGQPLASDQRSCAGEPEPKENNGGAAVGAGLAAVGAVAISTTVVVCVVVRRKRRKSQENVDRHPESASQHPRLAKSPVQTDTINRPCAQDDPPAISSETDDKAVDSPYAAWTRMAKGGDGHTPHPEPPSPEKRQSQENVDRHPESASQQHPRLAESPVQTDTINRPSAHDYPRAISSEADDNAVSSSSEAENEGSTPLLERPRPEKPWQENDSSGPQTASQRPETDDSAVSSHHDAWDRLATALDGDPSNDFLKLVAHSDA